MNPSQHRDLPYKKESLSFLIRIYFTQNRNWQGTIQWLDKNQSIPFKSTLDLILLLNEATDLTRPGNCDKDYRSWHDMALTIKVPARNENGKEGSL